MRLLDEAAGRGESGIVFLLLFFRPDVVRELFALGRPFDDAGLIDLGLALHFVGLGLGGGFFVPRFGKAFAERHHLFIAHVRGAGSFRDFDMLLGHKLRPSFGFRVRLKRRRLRSGAARSFPTPITRWRSRIVLIGAPIGLDMFGSRRGRRVQR